MNRKLFRIMTLVVTVLLTLAITIPALAQAGVVNFKWEEVFPAYDCNEDGENEIWIKLIYHWQVGYEYDENGELVPIILHAVQKWHIYNELFPDLSIKGITEDRGHLNNTNGLWYTGASNNFHAPGYPQIAHFSGYWTLDEEGNAVLEHGHIEELNVDLFCELLTPP